MTHFSYVKVAPENLWWAIAWWSYGLSDSLYLDCTPLMVTFEIWWFLGNIPGGIGLIRFKEGRTREALVLFVLCGVLQCYNATVYMFMTWHVDKLEPIAKNPLSVFIYWGFNGMWAVLSLFAARIAYNLFLDELRELERIK